jgi:hypothetical protein
LNRSKPEKLEVGAFELLVFAAVLVARISRAGRNPGWG